mgnify:CR=1 FL=1
MILRSVYQLAANSEIEPMLIHPQFFILCVSNWALIIILKLKKMEDLFKTLGEILKPEPNHFIDYDEDYDDDDFDNDDSEDWEERRQEELYERACNCTCGAWQNIKGQTIHVADCCCGAE